MNQRIVTRPDFDGVVCAVLLKKAIGQDIPIIWTQPNEIQQGKLPLATTDIVANLPLAADVHLWFDHHVSNQTDDHQFQGVFRIAPSAAGLVYEYFKDRLSDGFAELVHQTDKIDSAQLTLDEILHPENYPYVLLSMTIFPRQAGLNDYCNRLVELLGTAPISKVVADPVIKKRCEKAVEMNKEYEKFLKKYTTLNNNVSISDFRGLSSVPDGNRFLVYSIFPDAIVNVKLFNEGPHVVIKLGHSIVNIGCNVNVGTLLSQYGGGGHKGAGACRLDPAQADRHISDIIDILIKNQPID